MELRCFVAMALGHGDTDKVYDRLIVPTLRKEGITPIRIDRVEHNEDIDDRIIYELQRCDFTLADLTYARPSVYFEAGFAQRKVPVIYTCRYDHFSKTTNDIYGNSRVHFDLQMKNIIKWKSHSDKAFSDRLAKRVRHVIKPITHHKKKKELEKKESKEFASCSLHERIDRICDICIAYLRRAGYNAIKQKIVLPFKYYGFQENKLAFWLGRKYANGTLNVAVVLVCSSLKKSIMADFFKELRWLYFDKGLDRKNLKRMSIHMFFCSVMRIPISRISSYLTRYKLSKEEKQFTFSSPKISTIYKIEYMDIPTHEHIHILDAITTERAFRRVFSTKLKSIHA